MPTTIYEVIRGLEIARARSEETRISAKIHADKLDKLGMDIRLSLNQLPPLYRAEAVLMMTETASKIKMWNSDIEYVSNKLDTMVRELKVMQSEPMISDEQIPFSTKPLMPTPTQAVIEDNFKQDLGTPKKEKEKKKNLLWREVDNELDLSLPVEKDIPNDEPLADTGARGGVTNRTLDFIE